MLPIHILYLQQLNKWMYTRGISRVQAKFQLMRRWHYFLICDGIRNFIYVFDAVTGVIFKRRLRNHHGESKAIQIKDDLYEISNDSLKVTMYSNLRLKGEILVTKFA